MSYDIRNDNVSSFAFVKFEIILPLLCFFLPSYNFALQDMEFYDKLVDSFQDISKGKNPAATKA